MAATLPSWNLNKCCHQELVMIAGVNHAQFGDDKRNAARGYIKATVSLEQAQQLIAQVSDTDDIADNCSFTSSPATCRAQVPSQQLSILCSRQLVLLCTCVPADRASEMWVSQNEV